MVELLPIEIPEFKPAGWTPERQVRFLARLAETGNVRVSAGACGRSAQSVYKLRRRDALFARAWNVAILLARDHSEQVLAERALEGVEEAIYFRGELIGTRRRYDTRLLLAHIERLDRLAEQADTADAGQFDELLALVAGEPMPEGMAAPNDGAPVSRADHAASAVTAARFALDASITEEEYEALAVEEYEDLIDAVREEAAIAADRQWHAWIAQACAAVDRMEGGDRLDGCGRVAGFRLRTVSTVSTAALAAGQGAGAPRGPDVVSP